MECLSDLKIKSREKGDLDGLSSENEPKGKG
jgi:hypothetical protein